MVLDNVEEIEIARSFIPERNGHVLLTTRVGAVGPIARCIKLGPMSSEEATLLLLRRAKIDSANERDRNAARMIAMNLLAGLPLALDQAGAYIEETKCGFAGYIKSISQARAPNYFRDAGYYHPVIPIRS